MVLFDNRWLLSEKSAGTNSYMLWFMPVPSLFRYERFPVTRFWDDEAMSLREVDGAVVCTTVRYCMLVVAIVP
jgi:hypothetical protein